MKINSKKYPVVLAAEIIAIIVLVAAIVTLTNSTPSKSQPIQLPQDGQQKSLQQDSLYLYGSNEELTDMLFRLDVFFKTQGLNSDVDSPYFKPELATAGGQETFSTCVEFEYFDRQDNKPAVRFTLIPKNPECFSSNPNTIKDIKEMQSRNRYVYAVERL